MNRAAAETMEEESYAKGSDWVDGNAKGHASATAQLCAMSNSIASNAQLHAMSNSNVSNTATAAAAANLRTLDSGVRTKEFKLSDDKRAKNREKQRLFQRNKMLKEQIDTGFAAATRKVFLGDNRVVGRIVEVQQLSEMKDVRVPSATGHAVKENFIGAIVRHQDGSYNAVPEERFLVRETCYAKHGIHGSANWIIAKRWTGVVDGYVLIEWSNFEKDWVAKGSVMTMTTDRRTPRGPTQADNELKPSEKQLNQAEIFYRYFKSKPFLDYTSGGRFDLDTYMMLGGYAWEDLQREKKVQKLQEKRLDRLVVIALLNGIPMLVLPHKKSEEEEKKRTEMVRDVLKAVSARNNTPMMPMPKNKSEQWQLMRGEIHYVLDNFHTNYWKDRDSTPKPPLPSTLPNKEYQWRALVTAAQKTIEGMTEIQIPPPPSLCSRPPPPPPSDDEGVDLYLRLSLTYDVVRGIFPGRVCGQVDASLGVRAGRTNESNEYMNAIIEQSIKRETFRLKKKKEDQKDQAKPRLECKVRGCGKLVHKLFLLDGHCYVHGDEEKKKCSVCKKNTWCRAGKLCRKCYVEANIGNDQKRWCTVCLTRKARKGSDKCSHCACTGPPRKRRRRS